MNVKMTRGMRNNNPCNIRKNPHTWWKGAINGRDPEFVTFSDKAYGYRAVFITLNTYNRTHNVWSIRQIINRWAPKGDGKNDPQAYIRRVCELMGNLPETHTIVANAPYHDQQEEAIDFVMAMACVENGCKLKDINRSEVEEGMYLAFGKR